MNRLKSLQGPQWMFACILCSLSVALAAGSQAAAGQTGQAAGPGLQERHPRYQIQREDVLLLTFQLTPEINQTVTVQPDGYINLQNVGSVYAQGLTAPELVAAVKKAYQGVLHDPIVDIDIQDFQKPYFTVSGQVGKPGQYELRNDITVAEAIAVAGGMTMQTARTQVFLFHRTSKDWVEVKKVNLRDVLNGKHVNEDSTIQPGDMVYVPEKFISNFRKYVPYTLGAIAGSYLTP